MAEQRRNKIYIFLSLTGFAVCALLFGCINNDIPLPFINLRITAIQVEGQIGNAYIDTEERTVTVNLDDVVNIKEVKIEKLEYTEDAKSTLETGDVVNFTNPLTVTLSLYRDCDWTIIANQEFDRIFKVKDQIGETIIDVPTRRAIAFVGSNTNLKNITITQLQLGPSVSTTVPDISTLTDFSSRKTVIVMYHDVMEEWNLYVFHTDVEVSTGMPDVWSKVAWLKGEGLEGVIHGFQFREKGEEEWTDMDAALVNSEGGVFTARLTGLKESTEYVYRAVSDGQYGNEVNFTTEAAIPLSNGSFDDWHMVGNVWNPWASDGEPFWDTGNKGATTINGAESNSFPTDEKWSGKSTGKAAKLESKFVGLVGFGKFAAGNIYVGEYVQTQGTHGILDFGKPYTSYPTRLKGYIKYTPKPVDNINKEVIDFSYLKGEPDICRIYIALGDWNEPVRIRTRPTELKLFDLDDPNIIAYAEYATDQLIPDYQEISLELEYRFTNRKPKYLILVCTASKYGDYFTGGEGSTLWLDEFNLEFDY